MTTSRNRYEYDQSTTILPGRPWHLLVLSARSAASLGAATRNLTSHLQRNPGLAIADVAFTLQAGRRLFEHRRIAVCRDLIEAIEAFATGGDPRVHTFAPAAKKPRVAFVFPGEAPAVNAALELYETEPVFARAIAQADEELKPFLGLDLHRLLYPREQPAEAAKGSLRDAGAAAAALFAIEYALARLWESWGVSPAAVMGHGAGEYASACIAGLIEPADAAALAVARGRVLAGELEQAAFAKLAKSVRLRPARLPCVSSVTGTWMPEAEDADAGYWLRQLQWTSAVDAGIATLAGEGIGVLVQVGPGGFPAGEHAGAPEAAPLRLRSLSDTQSQGSDLRALIESLGHLYAAGVPVDWTAFYAGRRPRRTPLPSYAFEAHRHWFAHPGQAEPHPRGDDGVSPLDAEEGAVPRDAVPDLDAGEPTAPPDVASDLDAGELTAPPDLALGSRPDFGEAYVPPRDDVEEALVGLCEALLRIDGIGLHDNIIDLGVDSMFTMQLSREVAEVFGVAISPHHLFAEPNLASLAAKIRQLGPRNARMRGPAAAKPKARPATDRTTAEEYERILSFVEGLSETQVDEVLRRLAD